MKYGVMVIAILALVMIVPASATINTIVMMGGNNASVSTINDTWQSIDNGENWNIANGSAGWTGRQLFSSVVIPSDLSIIITGGDNPDGAQYFGDSWRSYDAGETWYQINTTMDNHIIDGHSAVALSTDEIILAGGFDGTDITDVVYSSTDYADSWQIINDSPGWAARGLHSSVVLADGSILVMGGLTAGGNVNDTWRSTDNGVTWAEMTSAAEWPARVGFAAVPLANGSVLVMGGGYDTIEGVYLNDTWQSNDFGASWTRINASSGWKERYGHSAIRLATGDVIVMGGYGNKVIPGWSNYGNDIWKSSDNGVTWTNVTATTGNMGGWKFIPSDGEPPKTRWSPRYNAQVAYLSDVPPVANGVYGWVTDSNSIAINGATVYLWNGTYTTSTTTDPFGFYYFVGVTAPSSPYTMNATKIGYQPYPDTAITSAPPLMAIEQNFQLAGLITLTVNVKDALTSQFILGNTSVYLYQGSTSFLEQMNTTTGITSFTGYPALDTYTIAATSEGYDTNSTIVTPAADTTVTVLLTKSSTLQQSTWYSPKQIAITVVSYSPSGVIVPHAVINLTADGTSLQDNAQLQTLYGLNPVAANQMLNGTLMMNTTTGEDGVAVFTVLSSIRYKAMVTDPSDGKEYTAMLHPGLDPYTIWIGTSPLAQNVSLTTGRNATRLWYDQPDAAHITMNVLYQDITGTTNYVRFIYKSANNMSIVCQTIVANPGTATILANWTVPNKYDEGWYWYYNASMNR